MVCTRKKRQSKRSRPSQPDEFDRDIIMSNAASDRPKNVVVNECTVDEDFFSNDTSSHLTAKDK